MIKVYNIYDFINYTKQNSHSFINYCEIIITPSGGIIIANPSHVETVIKYAMKKEGKTRAEINTEIPVYCLPLDWCIDKYGLIAVWYTGFIHSSKGINKFQRKSLNILKKHNLIACNYIKSATDYSMYIKRKNMIYAD